MIAMSRENRSLAGMGVMEKAKEGMDVARLAAQVGLLRVFFDSAGNSGRGNGLDAMHWMEETQISPVPDQREEGGEDATAKSCVFGPAKMDSSPNGFIAQGSRSALDDVFRMMCFGLLWRDFRDNFSFEKLIHCEGLSSNGIDWIKPSEKKQKLSQSLQRSLFPSPIHVLVCCMAITRAHDRSDRSLSLCHSFGPTPQLSWPEDLTSPYCMVSRRPLSNC
jgi:hypothetical protein